MIIVTHPTGNANVRALIQGVSEAGLLAQFFTAINVRRDSNLFSVLPRKVRVEFERRMFAVPADRISAILPEEWVRLLLVRAQIDFLTTHEVGMFSVDSIYRAFDQRVARKLARSHDGVKAVYCYEDGAAKTFEIAADLGIKRCYDLPIGYWRSGREILEEEAIREPEWAPTLVGTQDSELKLARKDNEISLATKLYVASSFTRETLAKYPGKLPQVEIVPYGAPNVVQSINLTRGRKLRVLFVGGLSQRKGLSYLLLAMSKLSVTHELTIIGRRVGGSCKALAAALSRHRYIPSLPHAGILAEMQQHDVLVFPSLFEGFGLVILEAMASGIPVITTPNTAGPDIFKSPLDGIIIPIRSADEIQRSLDLLASDRNLLKEMKLAAWRRAQEITWDSYRAKYVKSFTADFLS